MRSQFTSLTEEHVTRMLAKTLADNGHEIIAVHPPDGQGPFVIPKPKVRDDIERSSYHPDVVSLASERDGRLFLYISECKLQESDLGSDRVKLKQFASEVRIFLGVPNKETYLCCLALPIASGQALYS